MSTQITEAFVQEFTDNIMMLSQQKGSKLRPYVRNESVNGKAKAFDRIGKVDMVEKTSRHSDTPQLDTPHSRRWMFLRDFEWADLIDDQDKIRVLNEPTSEYVMAAMWAAGRTMDDRIIEAADATIKTGEDIGSGADATMPNTQKIAAIDGAGNFDNLNVDALRAMKRIFDANDVDESQERYIACTASQIFALLGDDRITSGDYNTVKALVDGKIDTYMGFKFIRLQRVLTQTTALSASPTTGVVGSGSSVLGHRKVIAWTQPSLILGIGQDVKSRISERDDKSYATQAYLSMSIGATRMEEEQVGLILCKE